MPGSALTIVFELAVPFVVLTRVAWRRKVTTIGLEGMHLSIMVFMGLVAFGLIFIGADSALLTDGDYRSLAALPARVRSGWAGRGWDGAVGSAPESNDAVEAAT